MLRLSRLLALCMIIGFAGLLQAETSATEKNESSTKNSANHNGSDGIEIKSHCHAHLTYHGCMRHWDCFWDDYQGRCRYR